MIRQNKSSNLEKNLYSPIVYMHGDKNENIR